MSDREKTAVIGALKDRFPVSALCEKLGIPRSSYCYAKAASCASGRHAHDRQRIRSIFEGSREAFGSERIWMTLKCGDDGGEPGCTSEKVARRITREEGLVAIYNKRRRRCSSCKGEIGGLEGDNHPVLHSDCGRHCRRPGRIGICSEYGIARSMSKKACSPDNAACEGFFGRLKNEFSITGLGMG